MKKVVIFVLFTLFIFTSCKKDKTNPTEPSLPEAPEGTSWKAATVNTNEIGGNNLSILTAYKSNSPVNNGSFKTIISQKGIQIVFVIDTNNNIRGLSYGIKSNLVDISRLQLFSSYFLLFKL